MMEHKKGGDGLMSNTPNEKFDILIHFNFPNPLPRHVRDHKWFII